MPYEVLLPPSDNPGPLTPMALWVLEVETMCKMIQKLRQDLRLLAGNSFDCFWGWCVALMCSWSCGATAFLPSLSALQTLSWWLMFLCLVGAGDGGFSAPTSQETAVQGFSRIFKGVKDNSEARFASSGEDSLHGCSGGAWICRHSTCLQSCTSFSGWIFETFSVSSKLELPFPVSCTSIKLAV